MRLRSISYIIYNFSNFQLNGVQIDRHHDNNYTIKVKGNIDEVVKKISKYKLRDLEIAQASLEDIFLEYYE